MDLPLKMKLSPTSEQKYTKVLFTYEYTWQNFRLRLLRLVDRLYSVIHKTQKS